MELTLQPGAFDTVNILVCGGRDYFDAITLAYTLSKMVTQKDTIITGGAKGADALAHAWALANGVRCKVFMADWLGHGKSAGPRRNERMLREGKPDLVLAFPGGRGTADMVRRAEKAGVQVVAVETAASNLAPKVSK